LWSWNCSYELGPGTIVEVTCVDGEIRKGELCKLPMYDTKGEIVRGINKEIPLDPSPWKGLSK
jgi:aminomethyltransferase